MIEMMAHGPNHRRFNDFNLLFGGIARIGPPSLVDKHGRLDRIVDRSGYKCSSRPSIASLMKCEIS